MDTNHALDSHLHADQDRDPWDISPLGAWDPCVHLDGDSRNPLGVAEQAAYDLLNVPPWATAAEIKAAYQEQMQQIHPSRLPAHTPPVLRLSAERQLQELQNAYDLLRQKSCSSPASASPVSKTSPSLKQPKPVVPIPQEPTPQGSLPWLVYLLATTTGIFAITTGILLSRPPSQVVELSSSDDEIKLESDALIDEAEDLDVSAAPDINPAPPTPEPIRLAQVDRFVLALGDLQPLLVEAEQRLSQTTDPAERAAIEQDFDQQATVVIESHRLDVQMYRRIARESQQNPDMAKDISEAARRLNVSSGSPAVP